MKLSQTQAKRCLTVSGWVMHNGKVLLVKHKMLGFWLAPGGHVDENELPHQAAEREVLEETGIKARTISAFPIFESPTESENMPLPFLYNLHWINKPGERKARSNGEVCEQHYIFSFFMEPVGTVGALDDSDDGVDAVKWFSREEIAELDTDEEIKREAYYVFDHYPQKNKK